MERVNKVAQAIKEEVAQILQREIKDPRVGFVTVTRVKVTADLDHVKIYFSLLDGHGSVAETEAGLRSAQGFIRRLLGERLRLRVTPELQFRSDPSVAEGIRIAKLLDHLKEEEQTSD
jgi:ribosome-binding factor A